MRLGLQDIVYWKPNNKIYTDAYIESNNKLLCFVKYRNNNW